MSADGSVGSADQSIIRHDDATDALVAWCKETLDASETLFDAGTEIARKLGAHRRGNLCEIGFWIPELQERRVPDGDISLEVLDPLEPLDLSVSRQSIPFKRSLISVARHEAFAFVAVEGMWPGTREEVGSFYALTWRDAEGGWHRINDPLAMSLPFGAFAPAEYYDIETLQRRRRDGEYFQSLNDGADGTPP